MFGDIFELEAKARLFHGMGVFVGEALLGVLEGSEKKKKEEEERREKEWALKMQALDERDTRLSQMIGERERITLAVREDIEWMRDVYKSQYMTLRREIDAAIQAEAAEAAFNMSVGEEEVQE